jgi:hypothetical protein
MFRWCAQLLVVLASASARIYDRCELARELAETLRQPVATWVCIAQHESHYNTSAIGRLNGDGSADHGLFQISELYWCDGGACDLPCSSLRDDDIEDDLECIQLIHKQHTAISGQGYDAWTVYNLYCNKPDVYKYVSDCFYGLDEHTYIKDIKDRDENNLKLIKKTTTRRPIVTISGIDKLLPITKFVQVSTTHTTSRSAPEVTETTSKSTPEVTETTSKSTPIVIQTTSKSTPKVTQTTSIPTSHTVNLTTPTSPRTTQKPRKTIHIQIFPRPTHPTKITEKPSTYRHKFDQGIVQNSISNSIEKRGLS